MKGFYCLPQPHKTPYFEGRKKSKSPLNNFRKTPPKNVFQKNGMKKNVIPGVTFSSKTNKNQQNTKNKLLNTPPPQTRLHYSYTNSDLGDFFKQNHYIDNIEQEITPFGRNISEADNYFVASLSKISEIRKKYYTVSIHSELDEVLNMIKQQKLKIGEKMKILKRNNEYYTNKVEGFVADVTNRATNTDQLLDEGFEKCYQDQSIQVIEEQLQEKITRKQSQRVAEAKKNTRNLQKQRQYYLKLCTMLQEMKINHEQILPQLDSLQKIINNKEYKMLGDAEVIKIQKFFIKKLAAKLPSK